MGRWFVSLALVVSVLGLVAAGPPSCDASTKCPASLPCCSQYGVCGIGSYCLGGCEPQFSNTIDSCMPVPQCHSKTYNFGNISNSLTEYSTYLGNSAKYDWTYSGYPLQYGENALLTMPANSAGTVLMSTIYVWYGKITTVMKTSRDQGVVSASILLSDVKDEIDYEFVGKDLSTAQTNIYWQALPYYGNSVNITNLTDTFENFHTYTIDWQPDQIIWSVDGVVGHTKTRASTWNSTSGLYNYPQTPSRIQLSIWPGGASDQAAGTIAWAGGPIDWNSPDIKSAGYYYMEVSQITVECYNPLPGTPTQGNGSVSYVYDEKTTTFLNNSVILSDKSTILLSQLGSGTNNTAQPSSSQSVSPSNAPQINGGGSAEGNRGGTAAPDSTSTGFSQGGKSEASSMQGVSKIVVAGSALVGLFVGGMFMLS